MAQLQATGVTGSLAISGSVTVNGTGTATFSSRIQGQEFFSFGSLNDTDGSFLIDHPSVQTWKIGITNSNTSTFSIGNDNGGAFATKVLNIANDNSMGFNYPILGSRSFMFRGISGRPLVLETAESGGVHSLYLRPNASGRHLISSNYLSGGVYLPLSLSGRENDADLVLNNGNVGINTTSPIDKLNVVGGATFTSTLSNPSNTSVGSLQVGYDGTNGVIQTWNSSPLLVSTYNYQAFNISGTERMRIGANGNIAIGDSPVLSTSAWFGALALGKSGTDKVVIGYVSSSTNGAVIGGHNSALNAWANINIAGTNIIFRSGETEYMRLTSGGNVGINTTSPTSLLQVTGTVSYGSIRVTPSSANGESAIAFFMDTAGTDTNDAWVIGHAGWSNTGDFVIGNENNGAGGNVRLLIEKAGNVGINTTSPTSRLSVCSTTACSTVVNVQGCAGQLFSVTDNLVGDIFSVSDISGIPILNVNSNGTVCVDSKIAVGANHTVSGAYASVTGGRNNTASGACSTVGGGCSNTASGYYGDTIGGGINNTAENGAFSTVAGGSFNRACNGGVSIGGGRSNQATGCNSTISGGWQNLTTGYASSILGGQSNWAGGNFATVVGGFGNTASCYYSVSANRCENTSASCQFRVGALSKASGTFRINHPDPTKSCTHYLSHSFVESPTAGDNIYRYKVNLVSGQAVITLPSYYKYLNENDQIWVTPQGHFGIGYGEINAEQTQVTIYGNADGEYNVLLIGTRKDHDAAHHWQGVETYK